MAIMIELVGRRLSAGDSGFQQWQISEAPSEDLAYALLNAVAPVTWNGLVKQRLAVEELGNDIWRGEATYGRHTPVVAGQADWSINLGRGGTQHITQSLSTASSVGDPSPAPNYKKALNVRETGDGLVVEGLDIEATTFTWTETHHIAAANLSESYLKTVLDLCGKVNSDVFRIFLPGEVRFDGLSGDVPSYTTRTPQAGEVVSLTFQFSASLQESEIPIGDMIVSSKEGWQYLWVAYKDVDDVGGSYDLVKQPCAAYVENIYHKDEFSKLNLPNPWPCGE